MLRDSSALEDRRMSSADTPDIAVLGLGRMGTAIAARLVRQECSVVGWTRSGREVQGITTVSDPGAAVGRASVVLLCLFDGEACFSVIDQVRGRLPDGAVVVNTSTVSPREAEALAKAVRDSGADYVHAPVIGSLPAVAAGTLTILSGGAEPGAATPVLKALGETMVLSSPAEAAAAKLLANGALGDTLLALRAGRAFAGELGLSEERAWSVLERTPVGGMVRAKRERLEKGSSDDGDFTAAALAKDLALLAGTAPSAAELYEQVQGALDAGSVAADDDIAAFAVAPRPSGRTTSRSRRASAPRRKCSCPSSATSPATPPGRRTITAWPSGPPRTSRVCVTAGSCPGRSTSTARCSRAVPRRTRPPAGGASTTSDGTARSRPRR